MDLALLNLKCDVVDEERSALVKSGGEVRDDFHLEVALEAKGSGDSSDWGTFWSAHKQKTGQAMCTCPV